MVKKSFYDIKIECMPDSSDPYVQDAYYIKKMLIPYLSTVYYKLVSR